MQDRSCRSRGHGRRDCGPADGSRPHGHGVESHAREDQAAGRRRRESGGDAGGSREHSEAIITMLTDAAAIDHVYNGERAARGRCERQAVHRDEHGAAEGADRAGARCARKARRLSNVRSAAPPRRRGRASCSASWAREPADAERAKPILDQLCRRLEHFGPVGTGALAKFTINMPLMVAWQAYGEAFAIAGAAGWEPKRLLDLFVDTNGANPRHEKSRRNDCDDVRRP